MAGDRVFVIRRVDVRLGSRVADDRFIRARAVVLYRDCNRAPK